MDDQGEVGRGEGGAVAEWGWPGKFGVKRQVWGLEGGVHLDAPGLGCWKVLTPPPRTLVTPRGFTWALSLAVTRGPGPGEAAAAPSAGACEGAADGGPVMEPVDDSSGSQVSGALDRSGWFQKRLFLCFLPV